MSFVVIFGNRAYIAEKIQGSGLFELFWIDLRGSSWGAKGRCYRMGNVVLYETVAVGDVWMSFVVLRTRAIRV